MAKKSKSPKESEKPENPEDAEEILYNEFNAVIHRYERESGLTIAQVIGVMEILKADLLREDITLIIPERPNDEEGEQPNAT